MKILSSVPPLSLAKSGLLVFLLALLLFFRQGEELLFELLTLTMLAGYHLLTDRRFGREEIRSAGLTGAHIVVYLLLCTLVVGATTGEEESVFWIVYLLPIALAASHLGLGATLAVCASSSALFVLVLPTRLYHDAAFRKEEVPELLVFVLTLFFVGVLIHVFSEENRRQLARQRELNGELLERQRELGDSLRRLEAAEESLRRRERLAALGEMAAGIAHEIRNPLGIISSSAQLLAGRMPAGGREGELLGIIGEEAGRMNRLITDFLAFGRPSAPLRTPCDLGELLRRAAEHLRPMAERQGIELRLDLPGGPLPARLDEGMMGQVLLNLLLNALEAAGGGGRVALALEAGEGEYAVRVSDTGPGIPEEHRGRIFTPFFTTKERGTGLGLANAYRMVESHGGELLLGDSAQGATFIVRLPAGEG